MNERRVLRIQTLRAWLHRIGPLLLGIALLSLLAASCSRRSSLPATATPAPVEATPELPAELPAPGATALPATTPTAPAPSPTTGGASQASELGGPGVEPPLQGQPNRLVIPRINLDVPVVDVGWQVVERGSQRFTEWETADNAAGRHINSVQPGEQGNVVLSGHHNTKGEVFRRISEMELAVGDAIFLYDEQGQRFRYVVDEITDPPLLEVGASSEQREENARYILPTEDARVTLVTCWPYWTNTHRVVVVGKLQE